MNSCQCPIEVIRIHGTREELGRVFCNNCEYAIANPESAIAQAKKIVSPKVAAENQKKSAYSAMKQMEGELPTFKDFGSGTYFEQAVKAAGESSRIAQRFRAYGLWIQWFGLISGIITGGGTFIYLVRHEIVSVPISIFTFIYIFLTIFIPNLFLGYFVRGASSYVQFKSTAYLAEKE